MSAKVSSDQIARAAAFTAATLHEAAGRIGALASAIKPMAPVFRVCGPVVTVTSAHGDNLWIQRALDIYGWR